MLVQVTLKVADLFKRNVLKIVVDYGIDDYDLIFKSPGVVLPKDPEQYSCRRKVCWPLRRPLPSTYRERPFTITPKDTVPT